MSNIRATPRQQEQTTYYKQAIASDYSVKSPGGRRVQTRIINSPRSKTNKIIVLDIDETCVHTEDRLSPPDFSSWNPSDVKQLDGRYYDLQFNDGARFWGVVRPGLREFLRFCFSYFDKVIVWSAGTHDYVQMICDRIFEGIQQPHQMRTRGNCYDDQKEYYKPLSYLVDKDPIVGLDATNTLFLDDKRIVAKYNPNNIIVCPKYQPSTRVSDLIKGDDYFIRLRRWLERPEVSQCTDVTLLDKLNI